VLEDEDRAAAYRASQRRKVAAKLAAERSLRGDPAAEQHYRAVFAPLGRSHPHGVPLIGYEFGGAPQPQSWIFNAHHYEEPRTWRKWRWQD
jgi:hypothetical protein